MNHKSIWIWTRLHKEQVFDLHTETAWLGPSCLCSLQLWVVWWSYEWFKSTGWVCSKLSWRGGGPANNCHMFWSLSQHYGVTGDRRKFDTALKEGQFQFFRLIKAKKFVKNIRTNTGIKLHKWGKTQVCNLLKLAGQCGGSQNMYWTPPGNCTETPTLRLHNFSPYWFSFTFATSVFDFFKFLLPQPPTDLLDVCNCCPVSTPTLHQLNVLLCTIVVEWLQLY